MKVIGNNGQVLSTEAATQLIHEKEVEWKRDEVRFILFSQNKEYFLYLQQGERSWHIDHAFLTRKLQEARPLELVGAGYFREVKYMGGRRATEARWDSGTCIEAFGYDRPIEKTLAEELLNQVKQLVLG